ncbi:MAG: hypothetical protein M1822_003111 [Bathelium mastoideum]|nr:MAG: hypothetical protein M1822_003111 [Bathelium mastoideum]
MAILNFRDVAQTINDHLDQTLLKTKLLYRSGRPDEATLAERQQLTDKYGVKTIIDLRTKTEHIEQARKRDARIKASAAVPQSNDAVTGPLKIPGITYRDINLNGSSYSRSLISKLSWGDCSKLVGLMAVGYRLEAISILGKNVMRERGLNGLAIDTLDACGAEFRQIFEVLVDEANLPVMIHCTQGKDRTGISIMLVLLLLGVPEDAIEHDYLLSEPELLPERESRLQEIHSMGLPDSFAGCPPDFVATVSGHITEKYGSVERYLLSIGVGERMQDQIKKNFRI